MYKLSWCTRTKTCWPRMSSYNHSTIHALQFALTNQAYLVSCYQYPFTKSCQNNSVVWFCLFLCKNIIKLEIIVTIYQLLMYITQTKKASILDIKSLLSWSVHAAHENEANLSMEYKNRWLYFASILFSWH